MMDSFKPEWMKQYEEEVEKSSRVTVDTNLAKKSDYVTVADLVKAVKEGDMEKATQIASKLTRESTTTVSSPGVSVSHTSTSVSFTLDYTLPIVREYEEHIKKVESQMTVSEPIKQELERKITKEEKELVERAVANKHLLDKIAETLDKPIDWIEKHTGWDLPEFHPDKEEIERYNKEIEKLKRKWMQRGVRKELATLLARVEFTSPEKALARDLPIAAQMIHIRDTLTLLNWVRKHQNDLTEAERYAIGEVSQKIKRNLMVDTALNFLQLGAGIAGELTGQAMARVVRFTGTEKFLGRVIKGSAATAVGGAIEGAASQVAVDKLRGYNKPMVASAIEGAVWGAGTAMGLGTLPVALATTPGKTLGAKVARGMGKGMIKLLYGVDPYEFPSDIIAERVMGTFAKPLKIHPNIESVASRMKSEIQTARKRVLNPYKKRVLANYERSIDNVINKVRKGQLSPEEALVKLDMIRSKVNAKVGTPVISTTPTATPSTTPLIDLFKPTIPTEEPEPEPKKKPPKPLVPEPEPTTPEPTTEPQPTQQPQPTTQSQQIINPFVPAVMPTTTPVPGKKLLMLAPFLPIGISAKPKEGRTAYYKRIRKTYINEVRKSINILNELMGISKPRRLR